MKIWPLTLGLALSVSACRHSSSSDLQNETRDSSRQQSDGYEDLRQAQDIRDKDLAIVLPKDSPIGIESEDGVLLKSAWFEQAAVDFAIPQLLRKSFLEESTLQMWKLVAVRIVPCEPLGHASFHRMKELCWPVIRQVWQAFEKDIVFQIDASSAGKDPPTGMAAHDRAFHITYTLRPELVLSASESERVNLALNQIARERESDIPEDFTGLSVDAYENFNRIRYRMTNLLLKDLEALRSPTLDPLQFNTIAVRPEMQSVELQSEFVLKLKKFLAKWTPVENADLLTALNVANGHAGRNRDMWLFASYIFDKGVLKAQTQTLREFETNKVFYKHRNHMMISHEESGEDLIISSNLKDENERKKAIEDEKQTILSHSVTKRSDEASIPEEKKKFLDGRQIQVANTTCASCHRFNPGKGNFHNLGYFEYQDLTVSPRVVHDVEWDKLWIRQQGLVPSH